MPAAGGPARDNTQTMFFPLEDIDADVRKVLDTAALLEITEFQLFGLACGYNPVGRVGGVVQLSAAVHTRLLFPALLLKRVFRPGLSREEPHPLVDYIFVLVTAAVAYHGLTYRDAEGERETVHLLFGAIALLFCLRVLFVDILKLV